MRKRILPTVGLAAIALLGILTTSTAARLRDVPPPVRLAAENVALGAATIKPGTGGEGLRVSYTHSDWPSVRFDAGKAYPSPDFSEVGGIALSIHNPNSTPLHIFVRVDDSPEADGAKHCRTGNAILAPDETATLVFPLSAEVQGMRAGPPLVPRSEKPKQLAIYGDSLNEKNIVAFQIFLAKPTQAYEMDLRSVRFVPKPGLTAIVDRWGQYTKDEWPGKIKSDADLKTRATEEKTWLDAHPPFADRDEYGGWKGGPVLKATGFFRSALVVGGKEVAAPTAGQSIPTGGRWWLVTPKGNLFWSAGVDCFRPYAEGPVKGRENLFMELPDAAKQNGQADFYHWNLGRKYGAAWQQSWLDTNVARLKSWGFNSLGNWSDDFAFQSKRIPYTVPLYVNGLPRIGKAGNALLDYFDPQFPTLAQGSMKDQTSRWKDDPWCLGYFVDNELAWDTWAQMGTGGEYVVARDALASPETQAARRAFIGQLKKKYDSPAAWSKAWGISVNDWDTPVTLTATQLNPAAKVDCAAFSTALAERYFSTMRDALKAVAPNQLYLGCRFAIRPPEMVAVAARYCDVVSFNIYEDNVDPKTWAFTDSMGKPVIIGEFHFGATDRGMFHPGLRERPTQADRATAYETYVKSVRARPAFVGCHWFQWVDEPVTGRFDGENYNIGFITVADTPYPEMRDAARRAHATLYNESGAGR